jgi:integrase
MENEVNDEKLIGQIASETGLTPELRAILESYRSWYEQKVGPAVQDNYVFPFGSNNKWNPSRPITTLKSSWRNIRAKAGLKARFHDLRHTAITNLCESGAPEATIMAIAGHVSRRMMERYAHIRTEPKRQAVERIVRQGSVPATSPDKKEVAS